MTGRAEPVADAALALKRAVTSLTRSSCTRSRLVERLMKQGFTRDASAHAADELVRLGYLDDRAVADSIVRAILRKGPAGKRLLVSRLRARGVEPEMADRVASEALERENPLDRATDAARAKMRALPPALDKAVVVRRVTGYLARRGIDAGVCHEAVRRAWAERESG